MSDNLALLVEKAKLSKDFGFRIEWGWGLVEKWGIWRSIFTSQVQKRLKKEI